jgi:hypothetical protein
VKIGYSIRAALVALATVALSATASAQTSDNEERKEGESPPPAPTTPTPPPVYTPPPPTTSVAEPPPAKKKVDTQEYDEPWVTGTARLADRFYEGGPFMGKGGMFAVAGLASDVNLSGVRVLENHGYLSKFTIAMMMAMGQRNSSYVGSTYHTDTAGNTWRTDYYRPLSPAEREANARAMQAAISAEYVFEMVVYSPSVSFLKKEGQTSFAKGFELYLGGETPIGDKTGGLPTILQIAFVGSHVSTDAYFKPGEAGTPNVGPLVPKTLYYTNLGVMLRAMIPITTWLEAYVHWDINILSLFAKQQNFIDKGYVWTSPLRAGVNVNLTDRAYVRGHGSLNALGTHGIGWAGEIGVRF